MGDGPVAEIGKEDRVASKEAGPGFFIPKVHLE